MSTIQKSQLWTFLTFFGHFTLTTSAPYGAIFLVWVASALGVGQVGGGIWGEQL